MFSGLKAGVRIRLYSCLRPTLAFFCVLLLGLSACTYEWKVEEAHTAKRTILAYLAADNELRHEAAERQAALLAGWSPSMGSLLIFVDVGQTPTLLRAVMHGGKAVAETVKTYTSTEAASPMLLADVIAYTRHTAPAQSYGLIAFGHATGWLPKGAFANPTGWRAPPTSPILTRSVFADGKHEMELADLAAAIPDGAFDFIAFDMCFMAGVEVAYALRHKTNYILASAAEMLSPGFLPLYPEHLCKLYAPIPDLRGFAEAFFAQVDKQLGVYRSATISIIAAGQLEPLAQLSRTLAQPLSLAQTDGLQYYDRNGSPHLFFDLGNYLHTLAQQAAHPASMAHSRIDELLGRIVIFRRHTERLINIQVNEHSGLSIYVPQSSLPHLNAAHQQTDWHTASH